MAKFMVDRNFLVDVDSSMETACFDCKLETSQFNWVDVAIDVSFDIETDYDVAFGWGGNNFVPCERTVATHTVVNAKFKCTDIETGENLSSLLLDCFKQMMIEEIEHHYNSC